MHFNVGGVLKLLRHPGAGGLRHQLFGAGNRAVHAFFARCQLELRAVGQHQPAPLNAHAVGHDQHQRVTLDSCDHGQADAGIARGRLDDGATGLQRAGLFCRFDHAQGNAVLDGAARVAALGFDVDMVRLASGTKNPVDTNVRRVTYRGEDAGSFHGKFPWVGSAPAGRQVRHGLCKLWPVLQAPVARVP